MLGSDESITMLSDTIAEPYDADRTLSDGAAALE
jgi:hypothetical protein